MNGLYCILGTALEGVPMLNLQFIGYQVLRREGVSVHRMSTTFKVSVTASLLSAAYNGGASVQSIAKNAASRKQKLCAGAIGASFTLSATLMRCLTFTNFNVYIPEYFYQRRTVHEQAKFQMSDFIPVYITTGSIIAFCLYFWLLHLPRDFFKSLRNPRRLLAALAYGYMSTNLGPLYPSISQANDANQLGSYVFRLKLCIVSLVHLLLDLAILCVTQMLGTLPRPYLIVSSVTAVGYIVFLSAYIKFDASCGPVQVSSNVSVIAMSSNVSVVLPAHSGDHDVNGQNFIPLTDVHKETKIADVDAVSHDENPSSQNTNLAICEKAEAAVDCLLEGQKQYISSHRHNVDTAEANGSRPLLATSLSMDRGMKMAIKTHRPCMAAWSSSLHRHSRAYSDSRGH